MPKKITSQTVKDLRTLVGEKIVNSVPEVVDSVVEALSQEEIKSRVKMVCSALKEVEDLDKQIKSSSHPDQKLYNEKGDVTSESFSKSQLDKLNGLKQKRAKIVQKVDNALKKNDFSQFGQSNDNKSDSRENQE